MKQHCCNMTLIISHLWAEKLRETQIQKQIVPVKVKNRGMILHRFLADDLNVVCELQCFHDAINWIQEKEVQEKEGRSSQDSSL